MATLPNVVFNVSLAVLLLLHFKFNTLPGKVCSWGASAEFINLESRRKFIRLGDVNIGVSLYMTGTFSDKLRYVGVEQLSQV